MNVRALVDFHDNQRGVERKAGEEFVVSAERFEEINAVGMEKISAPIVEEVVRTAEAKQAETPETRAKKAPARRRTAKKA